MEYILIDVCHQFASSVLINSKASELLMFTCGCGFFEDESMDFITNDRRKKRSLCQKCKARGIEMFYKITKRSAHLQNVTVRLASVLNPKIR